MLKTLNRLFPKYRFVLCTLVMGLSLHAAINRPSPCHGDVATRVFHQPACERLNGQHEHIVFKSRKAAVRAGYTPCPQCAE